MSIVIQGNVMYERTKINERGDCDSGYGGKSKLVDELERQEEKVYPNGTKNDRVLST
jgi:hypothetical protein